MGTASKSEREKGFSGQSLGPKAWKVKVLELFRGLMFIDFYHLANMEGLTATKGYNSARFWADSGNVLTHRD